MKAVLTQNTLPSSLGSASMTHELLHAVVVFQELLTCAEHFKIPQASRPLSYPYPPAVPEVNREGIIILLSGTIKLRHLKVKGHD